MICRLHGLLAHVEPELGLARFLIRTMTLETGIRENRADVAIELDPFRPGYALPK